MGKLSDVASPAEAQDLVQIGWAVRRARRALGLTQIEVARKLGVAPRTYGPWERTGDIPKMARRELAAVLKLSPSVLDPDAVEAVEIDEPGLGQGEVYVSPALLSGLSPRQVARVKHHLTAELLALLDDMRPADDQA